MWKFLKILLQQDEEHCRRLEGRHGCHAEDFGLYSDARGNEMKLKAANVK